MWVDYVCARSREFLPLDRRKEEEDQERSLEGDEDRFWTMGTLQNHEMLGDKAT